MAARFVKLVLFMVLLSIFIFACSKDSNFVDRIIGVRDIKALDPDPIPPDTLMLDSLDDPGRR